MNAKRILHVVLAMVGIGAMAAYLIACRPGWSPDGSKILFPYIVEAKAQYGVALHDRNTGETTSLFVLPPVTEGKKVEQAKAGGDSKGGKPGKPATVKKEAEKRTLPPSVQWDRSGKQAVVVWATDQPDPGELYVTVVSVASGKPIRSFVVGDLEVRFGAPLGFPLPEVDGCLFIGGGSLARLDLQTGEVRRQKLGGKDKQYIALLGHKDDVYYCLTEDEHAPKAEKTARKAEEPVRKAEEPVRKAEEPVRKAEEPARKAEKSARKAEKPAWNAEIGTLDTKSLALKPRVRLNKGQGVDEIGFPWAAVTADGSTMAIPGQKGDRYCILMVAGDKLTKTVPLELSVKNNSLGNLQWAQDGKTVYAALHPQDAKSMGLGVAEIKVDTGAVRITRLLARLKKNDNPLLMFQISVSPDGATIAAAATLLGDQLADPRDAVLYLVDLTDPDRKVTRIPPPSPVAARP